MAQIPTEIATLLRRYVKVLEQNKFPIKAAILFGSYSKGNDSEFSDIDVALVSDSFEGIRFLDKEKIRRLTIDVDHRLQPLPFKTEDFTEDDLFVKEIMKTGIRIV